MADDIFAASQSAQFGDTAVFHDANRAVPQGGIMGAIDDAWSNAANHPVETAAVAATALAATAALAYFKPWTLLQGAAVQAGEDVGLSVLRGGSLSSLVKSGIPINPEMRQFALGTLDLGVADRAAVLSVKAGMMAGADTSLSAAERLVAGGIPINPTTRDLASRGLLRYITGR